MILRLVFTFSSGFFANSIKKCCLQRKFNIENHFKNFELKKEFSFLFGQNQCVRMQMKLNNIIYNNFCSNIVKKKCDHDAFSMKQNGFVTVFTL